MDSSRKVEIIMITVNAMGDSCPIPVIKTKKAMQALTGPETDRSIGGQ